MSQAKFARNPLSWKHLGLSTDNSARILDCKAQDSLAEYQIVLSTSLKRIRYWPFKRRGLCHTTYPEYFVSAHLSACGRSDDSL